MQNFRIDKPCNENWSAMAPTEKGAFCKSCATDVHDFTNKSNSEIRAILKQNLGKKMCGQYTEGQMISLNADFDEWKFNSKKSMQRAMVFTLIVVFGMSLFSCTNEKDAQAISSLKYTVEQALTVQPKEEKPAMIIQEEIIPIAPIEVIDVKRVERVPFDEVVVKAEKAVLVERRLIESLQVIESVMLGASIHTDHYETYLLEQEEVIDPLLPIELDENGNEFPTAFSAKAFPNPTRDNSNIEFKMPSNQDVVNINLFNMSGELVQKVNDSALRRGTHTFNMNLVDLQPGIYLVVIITGDYKETMKISKI